MVEGFATAASVSVGRQLLHVKHRLDGLRSEVCPAPALWRDASRFLPVAFLDFSRFGKLARDPELGASRRGEGLPRGVGSETDYSSRFLGTPGIRWGLLREVSA